MLLSNAHLCLYASPWMRIDKMLCDKEETRALAVVLGLRRGVNASSIVNFLQAYPEAGGAPSEWDTFPLLPPLNLACRFGQTEVIDALLQYSIAHINLTYMDSKTGHTPLHESCLAEHPVGVSRLLPHQPDLLLYKNHQGLTALHLAAQQGRIEAVTALLSGSVLLPSISGFLDISDTEHGATALQISCAQLSEQPQQETILSLLLLAGADASFAGIDTGGFHTLLTFCRSYQLPHVNSIPSEPVPRHSSDQRARRSTVSENRPLPSERRRLVSSTGGVPRSHEHRGIGVDGNIEHVADTWSIRMEDTGASIKGQDREQILYEAEGEECEPENASCEEVRRVAAGLKHWLAGQGIEKVAEEPERQSEVWLGRPGESQGGPSKEEPGAEAAEQSSPPQVKQPESGEGEHVGKADCLEDFDLEEDARRDLCKDAGMLLGGHPEAEEVGEDRPPREIPCDRQNQLQGQQPMQSDAGEENRRKVDLFGGSDQRTGSKAAEQGVQSIGRSRGPEALLLDVEAEAGRRCGGQTVEIARVEPVEPISSVLGSGTSSGGRVALDPHNSLLDSGRPMALPVGITTLALLLCVLVYYALFPRKVSRLRHSGKVKIKALCRLLQQIRASVILKLADLTRTDYALCRQQASPPKSIPRAFDTVQSRFLDSVDKAEIDGLFDSQSTAVPALHDALSVPVRSRGTGATSGIVSRERQISRYNRHHSRQSTHCSASSRERAPYLSPPRSRRRPKPSLSPPCTSPASSPRRPSSQAPPRQPIQPLSPSSIDIGDDFCDVYAPSAVPSTESAAPSPADSLFLSGRSPFRQLPTSPSKDTNMTDLSGRERTAKATWIAPSQPNADHSQESATASCTQTRPPIRKNGLRHHDVPPSRPYSAPADTQRTPVARASISPPPSSTSLLSPLPSSVLSSTPSRPEQLVSPSIPQASVVRHLTPLARARIASPASSLKSSGGRRRRASDFTNSILMAALGGEE